jgi:23S rRNA pseudouridine2605 synthase
MTAHARNDSARSTAEKIMPPTAHREKVRLQKFLSDAGVASRRHAEELILDGRVLVNDEVVDALPAFVDPRQDTVLVDGTAVRVQPLAYWLVHKPKGVVCTTSDPAGRTRAIDLLPPLRQRLFVVGRLDAESTGLLLLTNDGELAQQVTHPRYGVAKVYEAEVRGRVSADLPEQMRRGVYLAEGRARASRVEIVRATNKQSILRITLREGRNRQVRRMLARLGHAVRKLKRLQIGPLSVKGLPVGAARAATVAVVKALRRELAEAAATQAARASRRRVRKSAHSAEKTGEARPRGRKGRGGRPGPAGPGRRIIS